MDSSSTWTINALREEHLILMERWNDLSRRTQDEPDNTRQPSIDSEREKVAHEFRELIAATGRQIGSLEDRDEAQGLIDYWSSAIAGLPGYTYPDILTLEEHDRSRANQKSNELRVFVDGLDSDPDRKTALAIFVELIEWNDHEFRHKSPITMNQMVAALQFKQSKMPDSEPTDEETVRCLIRQFMDLGVIVEISCGANKQRRLDVVDSTIAEHWPELSIEIRDQAAKFHERNELIALSERWVSSGKDAELLLSTNEAVDNALHYKGTSPILDEYIEASRDLRERGRKRYLTIVTSTAIVFAVVAAISMLSYWKILRQAEGFKRSTEMVLQNARAVEDKLKDQLARVQAEGDLSREDFLLAYDRLSRANLWGDAGSLPPPFKQETLLSQVSGAMWLGPRASPGIRDQNGNELDWEDLSNGTVGRIVRSTNLRRTLPTCVSDCETPYDLSPRNRKGVVDPAMLFRIVGQPRVLDSRSGEQVWSRVQIIPQVRSFFGKTGRRGVLLRMRTQIWNAGFEIRDEGQADRSSAGFRSQVRCVIRYTKDTQQPFVDRLIEIIESLSKEVIAAGSASGYCLGVHTEKMAVSEAQANDFALEFWYDPTLKDPSDPNEETETGAE